eukprot:321536-Pyramimonas_sp.AAC.1
MRKCFHERHVQAVDRNGARRASDQGAQRPQNGLEELSWVAAVQREPVEALAPGRRAEHGDHADAAQ